MKTKQFFAILGLAFSIIGSSQLLAQATSPATPDQSMVQDPDNN